MAFSVFTGAFTSRLPCAMMLYNVWDFNGSWHKWSFRSWFTFYSQSCWPSLATSAFANVFDIKLLVLSWQHYDGQWIATLSITELYNLVSSDLNLDHRKNSNLHTCQKFPFVIINCRKYNHKTHTLCKFNTAIANRVSSASYDRCGTKFTMHNIMS